MTDERKAFEDYVSEDGAWPKSVAKSQCGHYLLTQTAAAWNVWQARAALSAPAAPQPQEST